MAFRLIEVILPREKKEETEELLKKFEVMSYEYDESSKKDIKFNIVVKQDRSEELLEKLEKNTQNWKPSE